MRAARPSVAISSTPPLCVFVVWKASMPRPSRKQRVRRMLPPCVTSSAVRPSSAQSRRQARTRRCWPRRLSPPGKRNVSGCSRYCRQGSGSSRMMRGEAARLPLAAVRLREPGVDDERAARRRAPRGCSSAVSRGAHEVTGDDELDAAPRERATEVARLGAAHLVELHLGPARAARRLAVPVGLAVADEKERHGRSPGRWLSAPARRSVEVQQRVAAHADAQGLDRDDFFGRDVAEVHVGAELLDEPGLLLLDRRLEAGSATCRTRCGSPRAGRP